MRSHHLPGSNVLLLNLCAVIMLTGCATKQMQLTESGFLSSYTGFIEDENNGGILTYRNSDINIRQRYTKILIAPVQFKLNPSVQAHALDNEDRQKLASYFHEKLIEGLVKDYEFAEAPGPGVLLLRTAITDILPNKVYLNLHWSTTLMGKGIGGASLEAELVDSQTDERVLAFVDARKGKKLNYTKGLTKWGHTKEVLGKWAEIMVANLKEMRGRYMEDLAAADTPAGARP